MAVGGHGATGTLNGFEMTNCEEKDCLCNREGELQCHASTRYQLGLAWCSKVAGHPGDHYSCGSSPKYWMREGDDPQMGEMQGK